MSIPDCKPVKRGLKDFCVIFFSNGQIEKESQSFFVCFHIPSA